MSAQQNVGIIGMGVMGRNLALNIESRGYSVSIFNRTKSITDKIVCENFGKKIVGASSMEEFIFSLDKPRLIFLMVQAGKSIDQIIDYCAPLLSTGDILIDGGNSFYKDTICRYRSLLAVGIHFIGLGVSGGAQGALYGPSLMPGGDRETYNKIESLLKKIAASAEGRSCVAYIGPDGAGHYVKMVHNGIEYSDMQLIAESYVLLKCVLNLKNNQLADVFHLWNCGELNSYLIEITKNIFTKKTDDGCDLIDLILDEADHKGTGKWSSQSALDLGEPLSIITESVLARYLSSLKRQRIIAAKELVGPRAIEFVGNKDKFIEKIRKALYLGKIISYAQGFAQLQAASHRNEWNLNCSEIAKIFRAGCIIRAEFLQKIIDAYVDRPAIENLLLSPYFKEISYNYQQSLRDVVVLGVKQGISLPAFSAAVSYYDGYRSAFLPANLIQAQRDYFGSHGYKRLDREGVFYTKWT
ncbi:decarboxylating NADP(+)-dependent phosphogluconate dehydrogenase [Blochmannia endosymbiont of Camponotus (Colobopsis) obliquus]|uniref:decarboxylating NADP(+)-dependent phosphogluconate dehydrogenase n=1 Tax=Blochmannia endosymbiont of Camponotus (Colobopsis) obliquus TaxID=1505597 RepID=UPI00061A654F|nr:decarboxylating NADP(+)-dependent phosphogluconate dehydrogenase [Blochmannia endosymbiont of Camponotus (Colobopsis) obliquus]AKC60622.1 6-phosphogluconate dehydrogenase, decarboxylating [Blochmannia endosymbiont of Camponotus (Colobopsis) obliquus]